MTEEHDPERRGSEGAAERGDSSGFNTDIGGTHSGGQARSIGEAVGAGDQDVVPGGDETTGSSEGHSGADDES